MIRITHKSEAIIIPNIPSQVAAIVVLIAITLDDNYEVERDVEP